MTVSANLKKFYIGEMKIAGWLGDHVDTAPEDDYVKDYLNDFAHILIPFINSMILNEAKV